MYSDEWGSATYKSSNDFNHWEVTTANTKGFEAASNVDWERGIDYESHHQLQQFLLLLRKIIPAPSRRQALSGIE